MLRNGLQQIVWTDLVNKGGKINLGVASWRAGVSKTPIFDSRLGKCRRVIFFKDFLNFITKILKLQQCKLSL